MKGKCKHWCSTIQQISSKRTTTARLKPLNTNRPRHMTLVWNPGSALGQRQHWEHSYK